MMIARRITSHPRLAVKSMTSSCSSAAVVNDKGRRRKLTIKRRQHGSAGSVRGTALAMIFTTLVGGFLTATI